MAGWQEIGDTGSAEPGEHLVIELPDYSVLLVNLDGHYYAVENICPHDGGKLDGGLIANQTVTCPRHGACFCLKTGKVLKAPAFEDLLCFEVRVEHGRLQLADQPKD